jgi:serine phosphatase RsbU (regulator of sigma subunit)
MIFRGASFNTKFLAAICFAMASIVAIALAFSAINQVRLIKGIFSDRVKSVALTAAAFLDVDVHQCVLSRDKMDDAVYQRQVHAINKFLLNNPDIRFLYSIREVNGESGMQYRFVLDGGAAGEPMTVDNFNFSKPGDLYENLSAEGRAVFRTGVPATTADVYTDKWGTFLTGYAPVKDKDGRIIAVVGADVKASDINATILKSVKGIIFVAITVFLVGFIMMLLVRRMVSEPLKQLSSAAIRVGHDDFDHPIETDRSDEFGQVFATFNNMISQVRESRTRVAEHTKTQIQIDTAATLQKHLFRGDDIDSERIQVSHFVKSADEICGDWCHYSVLFDRYLYLICGDVTGHGIASGIVSSVVAGGFEGLKASMVRSGSVLEPHEILGHLDNVVKSTGGGEFVMSMVAGLLDLSTGEFRYANAAHLPPIVARNSRDEKGKARIEIFRSPADFLGIDGFSTETRKIQLGPGDTVLFYSDGLTEIFDDQSAMYGQHRLRRVLQTPVRKKPADTVSDIIRDVEAFAGRRAMEHVEDDVSLIVAHIPVTASLSIPDGSSPITSASSF